MQIQILNGVFTEGLPDFRIAYPRNLIPIAQPQGISSGYLRPGEGINGRESVAPGIDRAGINWNGEHYRVMGSKLVEISEDGGRITTIGDVETNNKFATMNYSFDRLSISSNGKLFYYDGTTLSQVTDADLGVSLDHIWIDGYFMSTDGEFVVVTELGDPFSVLPTKYASSEVDPDPILALLKVNNEAYILNRHTIEIFENIGGTGFPFQRIEGAQFQHGPVGTHTCCVFLDTIVFVGSGRNEGISVWQSSRGNEINIASREVERVLGTYSEDQLSNIQVESRVDDLHRYIYIHLPDETLVFDFDATRKLGQEVWYFLSTDESAFGEYRARSLVFVYDKWWVGDTVDSKVGTLTMAAGEQWGVNIGWEFSLPILFNEGSGAIIHELELISLSSDKTTDLDTTISTQFSEDGQTFSTPQGRNITIPTGKNKKITWIAQGSMGTWRIQKFSGKSDVRLSFARLEAKIEPLTV